MCEDMRELNYAISMDLSKQSPMQLRKSQRDFKCDKTLHTILVCLYTVRNDIHCFSNTRCNYPLQIDGHAQRLPAKPRFIKQHILLYVQTANLCRVFLLTRMLLAHLSARRLNQLNVTSHTRTPAAGHLALSRDADAWVLIGTFLPSVTLGPMYSHFIFVTKRT